MQKKSLIFFSFPNKSIFNAVKDTDKREKNQMNLDFSERENLRRCQRLKTMLLGKGIKTIRKGY